MDRDIGEHHLRALIDLIYALGFHANGGDAGGVVFGEDGLFQVVAGQGITARAGGRFGPVRRRTQYPRADRERHHGQYGKEPKEH
jgi:hypothetical protein